MIGDNKSGFTLIEVLMAVALLALGLFSLSMMQGHFASGNSQSRQIIRATDIATAKLDELANADLDHSDLDTSANPHTETITDYPLDYTLQWDVVTADTEIETDQVLDIDLTVSWTQGGQGHSLNFHWIREN